MKLSKTHIRLEKIGWIRLAEQNYLPVEWKALSYRIRKEGIHWYVSITAKMVDPVDTSKSTGNPIGMDLGVHTLATLSNGKKYPNPNTQTCFKRNRETFETVAMKGFSQISNE